jgi:hypothetical protein
MMIFSFYIAPTFVITAILFTHILRGKTINAEVIFPLIAIVLVIQVLEIITV